LSQDDAEAQGLQQIADDMTLHLAMYFTTLDQNPPQDQAPKQAQLAK
jgi:hypothetical protein